MREKKRMMFNRNYIILFHDNAEAYAALGTRQKVAELDWEVLSHPLYYPDLAPSDYHLFLTRQNFSLRIQSTFISEMMRHRYLEKILMEEKLLVTIFKSVYQYLEGVTAMQRIS